MKGIYTCPMHPEIIQNKSGSCPKCGMRLIKSEEMSDTKHNIEQGSTKAGIKEYKPLIVIIGLILLVALTISVKDGFVLKRFLSIFMSGFFIVFAGFKLLDLKGFAEGYYTYDLLAQKLFSYGYIYPFIELILGLLYILVPDLLLLNIFSLIIMTFSGIGVVIKLLKHEEFQCACLGTVFKLPLTKVTLIEDFGMAAMALLMIVL